MNRAGKVSFVKWSAVAALAVLAQGCATQPSGPQEPMVRQTSQTAPADLQLMCANEVAQTYGVASEQVLPISSSTQGTVYTVVLNAGETQAVCTIDEAGTILSLDRA